MYILFESMNQSLFSLKRLLTVNSKYGFKTLTWCQSTSILFCSVLIDPFDHLENFILQGFVFVWFEIKMFVLYMGIYGFTDILHFFFTIFLGVLVSFFYRNASPGVEWCSSDGENL